MLLVKARRENRQSTQSVQLVVRGTTLSAMQPRMATLMVTLVNNLYVALFHWTTLKTLFIDDFMFFFQTSKGNVYGVDTFSGEIILLGNGHLDDMLTCTSDARLVAERGYGSVRRFQQEGYFAEKNNSYCVFSQLYNSSRENYVVMYRNEEMPIESLMQNFRGQLMLEMTEACNLRCKYCVYSGAYSNFRPHSNRVISFETCCCAIDDFIDKSIFPHRIGFTGGEPLLAFDLIKRVVLYANKKAREFGKNLSFLMTTNGTLLDGEKIDFLIEHGFQVAISLDGPKEIHDKNRRFASSNNSVFETINTILLKETKKIEKSGLFECMATLAPPFEIEKRNKYFSEIFDLLPLCMSSTLRPSYTICRKTSLCNGTICDTDLGGDYRPEFQNMLYEYLSLAEDNLSLAKKTYPLIATMFWQIFEPIHNRATITLTQKRLGAFACLPGFHRLFCDVTGNYYACDRAERDGSFVVGDVREGFQSSRAMTLIHKLEKFINCSACDSQSFCSFCFGNVHVEHNEHWDSAASNIECKSRTTSARRNTIEYVSIMEDYRNCVNRILHQDSLSEDMLFSFVV